MDQFQDPAPSGRSNLLGELASGGTLVLAFIASLALSGVSLITTFKGMESAFQDTLMAGAATFGVQVIAFIVSWLFAYHLLKRRWSDMVATGLALLVAGGISVFFSFVDVYGRIYNSLSEQEKQNERNLAGQQLRGDVYTLAEDALTRKKDEASEAFVQSSAFRDWEAAASQVMDASLANSDALDRELQRRQEASARAIEDATARIEAASITIRTSESRIGALDTQLGELEADLVEQSAARDARQRELSLIVAARETKQQEMDIEEGRGGTSQDTVGLAGRGPRWKALKAEYDALEPEYNERRLALDRQIRIVDSLEAQRDGLAKELEERRSAIEAARIDRSNAEKEITERSALVVSDTAEGVSTDVIINRFRGSIEAFKGQRDFDSYQGARRTCNQLRVLLVSLQQSRGTGAPFPEDCDNPEISIALPALSQAASDLARFQQNCVNNREDARLEFDAVIPRIRQCVEESGVDIPIATGLRRMITQTEQLQSLSRTNWTAATAAFRSGSSDMFVAFSIATVVDLLVVVVAAFGQSIRVIQTGQETTPSDFRRLGDLTVRPEDSADLAALKRMLSNMVVGRRRQPEIDLSAAHIHSDAHVKALVNWIVYDRKEATIVERDGRSLLSLTQKGFATLLENLKSLRAQRDAGPAVQTTPATVAMAGSPSFNGAPSRPPKPASPSPQKSRSFLDE
ncbi:MAG: hypothetical protein AAFV51_05480 [Pseudomonadota bacterium]